FLFRRQTQSQTAHPELGCCVRGAAEATGPLAGDGVDVDDQSAAALDHPRQDGVDAVKGAVQVGPNDALPALGVQFAQTALLDVHPRVVHQDVETAETFDDLPDERLHLHRIGNVGRGVNQALAGGE